MRVVAPSEAPSTALLRLDELSPGVAALTLTRPAQLNALSPPLIDTLIAQCQQLHTRADLKVLVLRGEGRAFCAGFDLDFFKQTTGQDRVVSLGRDMAEAVANLPMVTVAALQGACIGSGAILAAACDVRVADDSLVVAIPEVDMGIPLIWSGIPRLMRVLGPALTHELVLSCRRMMAAEAEQRGFVSQRVPVGTLDAAALALAERLAAKSNAVLRQTKALLAESLAAAVPLNDGAHEAAATATVMADAETAEKREAYLRQRRR